LLYNLNPYTPDLPQCIALTWTLTLILMTLALAPFNPSSHLA